MYLILLLKMLTPFGLYYFMRTYLKGKVLIISSAQIRLIAIREWKSDMGIGSSVVCINLIGHLKDV